MAKRKTNTPKEEEAKKAAAEAEKADKKATSKAKAAEETTAPAEAAAEEAAAAASTEETGGAAEAASEAEGKEDKHEAIRDFMAREASGEGNTGKTMKYDPKLKRFVIVDADDSTADDLPAVTPEDLQSF